MTDRPAIKPLEWVEHGDQDFVWHRATPPIGFRYNIEDDGFSEKKHHLTVGQLVIGNFDTLYEAKAAAQADYERRIRSCLLDKPEAGARGCEGRNYTCTCGCDDRRDVLIDKLVKALEVARGAINENEHFEDVADVLDAALSAAGGEE